MKLEKVFSRSGDWILFDPVSLQTKARCDYEQDAQTIAHRVNVHDELVAFIEGIIEGCSKLDRDMLSNIHGPGFLASARAALERAKQ